MRGLPEGRPEAAVHPRLVRWPERGAARQRARLLRARVAAAARLRPAPV